MNTRAEPDESPQDEAARAGWLYYVAGMTQDEIARQLGVSRQRAQRLVSRAIADGLINVRLNHRIGACMTLEAELKARFALRQCRIAPTLGPNANPNLAIGGLAAAMLENFLRQPDPLIIALGTGRALRAMVDGLLPINAEQHKIVSILGNIAPDGSASFFDVIMRIADKVHAPHYPMPLPVILDSPEARAMFYELPQLQVVINLAQRADVTFVGVGQIDESAPIRIDGFVTAQELKALRQAGAVGEIASFFYDAQGRYLDVPHNYCVGGMRVASRENSDVIGVAAGPTKHRALHAALTGKIINGLITDEDTAHALLH